MLRAMIAAASLTLATSAGAADRTVTLEVDKMTCASCPYIVEKAIERVEGVAEASVSYDDHTATVRFDDERTNVKALTEATRAAGYPSQRAR